MLLAAALACLADDLSAPDGNEITVVDLAPTVGAQGAEPGTVYRGRACNAADYNDDGALDLWVGNPGDPSYLLLGGTQDGVTSFDPAFWWDQGGTLAWAASSADYDNDGDVDVFVSVGGNEGVGTNLLLENTLDEGSFGFREVASAMGVARAQYPGAPDGLELRNAGGAWADVENDGDLDLFVSVNIQAAPSGPRQGENLLYRNDGDHFTEITREVGLSAPPLPTRHSTWLDADNDGDVDLYENNFEAPNRMWRNMLVEEGNLRFTDVTAEWARDGERLDYPWDSFASAAADLNNDGWTDLIVFAKGWDPGVDSPYEPGHALFMNTGALGVIGFVNVAEPSGVNAALDDTYGVMGCQVADLDADGVPDIYVGNGNPEGGSPDALMLSRSTGEVEIDGAGVITFPIYTDASELIDFPADMPNELVYAHPYPYHTHGVCAGDFDADGYPELFVANGGPALSEHAEPDRLFDFIHSAPPAAVRVRLRGDGEHVSLDAVQSSVRITWSMRDGSTQATRAIVQAGSAFSAQNDNTLFLAMPGVARITAVEVVWSDGTTQSIDPALVPVDPHEVLEVTR
jgi:hypothetical protein